MVGLTREQKEFRSRIRKLPEEIKYDCGCTAKRLTTGYTVIKFCKKHDAFKEG